MTTEEQTQSSAPFALRFWENFRGRSLTELVIENLILLTGVSVIVIVTLIFLFLLREGAATFLDIPLRQLFGNRWYPIEDKFGLWPLIAGSFWVTVGAVIIAVPLGLTTAIYMGNTQTVHRSPGRYSFDCPGVFGLGGFGAHHSEPGGAQRINRFYGFHHPGLYVFAHHH
jgi:hypothetical protein